MDKHIHLHISGKVQGVFYRASAQEKAIELGVKGFVRNEKDGSVYIEAEGEAKVLEAFVAWCQQGPRHARVDECQITEGTLKGFENFSITR